MKTRLEQLEIELAFEKGAKIEMSSLAEINEYHFYNGHSFRWDLYDYRVKQEPLIVPFDVSDAFNLLGEKFRSKNKTGYLNLYICTQANDDIVLLSDLEVTYESLSIFYEKWNNLLQVWESCSKIK